MTTSAFESTEAERLATHDAIAEQAPFEHAHRVEICVRAMRVLSATPDVEELVRLPVHIAYWQIATTTYERTLMGAEESRDAWKAYAEHRETCSQDCYHEFSGNLVLCVEGQRLRDAAVAS